MVRKSMTYGIGNLKDITFDGVLNTINSLMEDTLSMTKEDLRNNIKVIPKDTGVMRQTVLSNIAKSVYTPAYRMDLFFGANELAYTQYVEKMATEGNPHVRHADKDPQAEGHPFAYMANFCKERLHINWNKSKINQTGGA